MIVLNLELDNLFGFENFSVNFSYPKKIINSSIENETLEDRPNFRYKKINILIGTNASGKTSIGKALMAIFNFFEKRESASIMKNVKDSSREASFLMDFVIDGNKLYRIRCFLNSYQDIKLDLYSVKINKKDSYESALKRIKKINTDSDNYTDTLKPLEGTFGWLFTYPDEGSNSLKNPKNDAELKIFENILKTLDPSVKNITKIEDKDIENAYKLELKNTHLIIQDGKFIDSSILSSGTKAGIDIAAIVASIKKNSNGFYYCDEKFSYIHSDIEKAILSLMIDLLAPNTQLFFTTHNLEVLDLDLPHHSFIFLKKKDKIEAIFADDYLKKNEQSLKNAIKNDLFNAAPNLELIYELGDI